MTREPSGRSPEAHRAGPREQRRAWAPSQAAAATGGQGAGRQLSEAALAIGLTSTRNAMAGSSQSEISLLSRSRRQDTMLQHQIVEKQRISLVGGKRHH